MSLCLTDVLIELVHHIRLSFFAVIVGMISLYFWPMITKDTAVFWLLGSQMLDASDFFHIFHYPHITFAAAACFIVVFRYAHHYWLSLLVSFLFPTAICTLSDIILPYLGGNLLGVAMDLHVCVFCNTQAVALFLAAGILLGFAICFLDRSGKYLLKVGLAIHFLHELVSAVASLAYMVGFGFYTWQNHLLMVLILMFFAVVVPCVISDFLMPVFVVMLFKKNEVAGIFCAHEAEKKREE